MSCSQCEQEPPQPSPREWDWEAYSFLLPKLLANNIFHEQHKVFQRLPSPSKSQDMGCTTWACVNVSARTNCIVIKVYFLLLHKDNNTGLFYFPRTCFSPFFSYIWLSSKHMPFFLFCLKPDTVFRRLTDGQCCEYYNMVIL